MQWVEYARLPLTREIKAIELPRRPVKRFASGERFGIERSRGQMKRAQVVGDVDMSPKHRQR